MARYLSAPLRGAEAFLTSDSCTALLEYPLTQRSGKSSCSLRRTAFRPLSEPLASSESCAAPVAAEISAGSREKGDLVLRRASPAKVKRVDADRGRNLASAVAGTRSVDHPLCPSLAAVACDPWRRGERKSPSISCVPRTSGRIRASLFGPCLI